MFHHEQNQGLGSTFDGQHFSSNLNKQNGRDTHSPMLSYLWPKICGIGASPTMFFWKLGTFQEYRM